MLKVQFGLFLTFLCIDSRSCAWLVLYSGGAVLKTLLCNDDGLMMSTYLLKSLRIEQYFCIAIITHYTVIKRHYILFHSVSAVLLCSCGAALRRLITIMMASSPAQICYTSNIIYWDSIT